MVNEEEAHPIALVVSELVSLLGPEAVALIAGVDSIAAVQEWMSGCERPRHELQLRHALKAAKILLADGL